MSHPYSHVSSALQSLEQTGAHRATVFVSPTHTIKVCRRSKLDRREKRQDFVLTIGTPNWHERQRIKQFIKVGEPFPVKKVQLQYPPKR